MTCPVCRPPLVVKYCPACGRVPARRLPAWARAVYLGAAIVLALTAIINLAFALII